MAISETCSWELSRNEQDWSNAEKREDSRNTRAWLLVSWGHRFAS